MGLFSTPCPNCGERVGRGQDSCTCCSARLGGPLRICGHGGCVALLTEGDRFCGGCGHAVGPDLSAVAAYWRPRGIGDPRRRDVARHFRVEDVSRLFEGGVVVSHGLRALLFLDGRLEASLPPGRHGPDIAIARKARAERVPIAVSVLLVDEGSVEVQPCCRVVFSDNTAGSLTATVVLRVQDPVRLFENAIKDKEDFTPSDLLDSLLPSLRAGLQAWARGRRQQEAVSADRALRETLRDTLQHEMLQPLEDRGLELKEVRDLELSSPAEQTEEIRREVAQARDRLQMLQTLRKAVQDGKVSDANAEEDLAKELGEIDKRRILREADRASLLAETAFTRSSAELKQRSLLKRIEIQSAVEEKRLSLMEEGRLQKDLLELDVEREKLRQERDLEATRLTWMDELQKKKAFSDLGLYEEERRATLARQDRAAQQAHELERAHMMADSQIRTIESLKGMSPQQMLGWAASNNPDAARYLVLMQQQGEGGAATSQKMLEWMMQQFSTTVAGIISSLRSPAPLAGAVAVATPSAVRFCPRCGEPIR